MHQESSPITDRDEITLQKGFTIKKKIIIKIIIKDENNLKSTSIQYLYVQLCKTCEQFNISFFSLVECSIQCVYNELPSVSMFLAFHKNHNFGITW